MALKMYVRLFWEIKKNSQIDVDTSTSSSSMLTNSLLGSSSNQSH